jgi:hypothetical protein
VRIPRTNTKLMAPYVSKQDAIGAAKTGFQRTTTKPTEPSVENSNADIVAKWGF